MPKFGIVWIALTSMYCSGIFYLSSLQDLDKAVPAWLDWPGADKAVHAALYGGLAGLVAMGLRQSNPRGVALRTLFLAPVVFAVVYGVSDEFHQAFVPTRSPDPLDLLADAAGATIIAGVYTTWVARFAQPGASSAKGNSTGLPGD